MRTRLITSQRDFPDDVGRIVVARDDGDATKRHRVMLNEFSSLGRKVVDDVAFLRAATSPQSTRHDTRHAEASERETLSPTYGIRPKLWLLRSVVHIGHFTSAHDYGELDGFFHAVHTCPRLGCPTSILQRLDA